MKEKLQKILTHVVTFLRQQKGKCLAETCNSAGVYQCLYRNSSGQKCAAGCLIPDEDYLEAFEGHGVDEDGSMVNLYFREKYSWEEIHLIIALQNIHDTHLAENWEQSWTDLAQLYGLILPTKEQDV